MNRSKCYLCFKNSKEFPGHFKAVLTDIRQSFNNFQSNRLNCSKTDKLKLCKSCWIYFMRIHQLSHALRLKKKISDAEERFLSTKIRQSQRPLVEKRNNAAAASWEDLEIQSSASKENDDSNYNGRTLDGVALATIHCSLSSTDDSVESCDITKVYPTDHARVSEMTSEREQTKMTSDDSSYTGFGSETAKYKTLIHDGSISAKPEEEPMEVTSDGTSDTDAESEPVKAKPNKFIFTYENKWLPSNLTLPKFSFIVKQVSATGFLYTAKYPFQGTEFGFKCGLCRVVSTFAICKRSIVWENVIKHIKNWHMGDQSTRSRNTQQRCVQVGPNRYQYGEHFFEHVDEMYQCGECGVLKIPAKSSVYRNQNILQHIIDHHHEKKSKQYVCEYCGVVYHKRDSLRCHTQDKHNNHSLQIPCSECGKNFGSRSSAVSHRYHMHLKRRKFICEICGKSFTQKKNLEIHVASVHKKQKIKCAECGKVFGSQRAIEVHRYSHTGKKYSCDICGMDFTQAYSVTRHKKTAHNE